LGREAAEAELHRTEREARKARMRIKEEPDGDEGRTPEISTHSLPANLF
jgi:hypothetical protein